MVSDEGVAAPATTRPWPRKRIFAALAGAVTIAAVGVSIDLLPPEPSGVLGSAFVLVSFGLAGILLMRNASRLEGRERLAWRIIGAGVTMAALGVAVFAVALLFDPDMGAFGPVDIVFLTAYAAMGVGFASLPHVRAEKAQRVRLLLDALVGGVSLGTLLWALVVGPLISRMPQVGPLETIVAMAYPILDLILLVMVMIVVVRRSALRFDLRLVVVGLTLTVQAASDLRFLTHAIGSSFAEAHPSWGLLGTAAGLAFAAALLVEYPPPRREYAERRPSLIPMIFPYLVAGMLVVVLISTMASSGVGETGFQLLVGFLITTGLVVARQAVAIRENRELVEAQRKALVSSVSHELRTPLAAVVGFLSLLADDSGAPLADEERRELVALADEHARHMARIVEDLILLARGDLREIELHEEILDPAELVGTAVNTLDAPGVTFLDETGGWHLRGDPDRLRQVVTNLISNAVRYGGPTRLVVFRREGTTAFLEVHDDGPGVPRRHEATIWERFERGAHRFNAAVPGSGIGLAIVEAIAVAHGGTARYRRSERLGGACFGISLPERAVPAPSDPIDVEATEPVTA